MCLCKHICVTANKMHVTSSSEISSDNYFYNLRKRAAAVYIHKEEKLVSAKYFVLFPAHKSQFLCGDGNRGTSQKPISSVEHGLWIPLFQTRKHETGKVKTS